MRSWDADYAALRFHRTALSLCGRNRAWAIHLIKAA